MPIQKLRFGAMLPDAGDNETPQVVMTNNVIQHGAGLVPINSKEVLDYPSGPEYTYNVFSFNDQYFYSGDYAASSYNSQIREYKDTSGTFASNIRNAATLLPSTNPQFARFGDNIIYTDGANPVKIQTARETNFVDCFEGVNRPKFKYVGTLGERVVYANGSSLQPSNTTANNMYFMNGINPEHGDPFGSYSIGYPALEASAGFWGRTASNQDPVVIEMHLMLRELPADQTTIVPIYSMAAWPSTGALGGSGASTPAHINLTGNDQVAIYVSNDTSGNSYIVASYYNANSAAAEEIYFDLSSAGVAVDVPFTLAFALSEQAATGNPKTSLWVNGVRQALSSSNVYLPFNNSATSSRRPILYGSMMNSHLDTAVILSHQPPLLGELRLWIDDANITETWSFDAAYDNASNDLSETTWSSYEPGDSGTPIPGEDHLYVWLRFRELTGSTVANDGIGRDAELKRFNASTNPPLNEGPDGAWFSFAYTSDGDDLSAYTAGTPLEFESTDSNNGQANTVVTDPGTDGFIYLQSPVNIESHAGNISIVPKNGYPGEATDENLVWWSATNNARFVGTELDYPALSTGYNSLQDDYGVVTGLSSGRQWSLVFKERAIYRMSRGTQLGFDFQQIAANIGTIYPNSIVEVGDNVYFWGPDGPSVANASEAMSLTTGKVSRTLLDSDFLTRDRAIKSNASVNQNTVFGTYSSTSRNVLWAYTTEQGNSYLIAYSIDTGSFSFCSVTVGLYDPDTNKETNYDYGGFSETVIGLCSRSSYAGQSNEKWRPLGDIIFSAANIFSPPTYSYLCRFDPDDQARGQLASPLTPWVETGWIQFNPEGATQISRVRPMFSMSRDSENAPECTLVVRSKDYPWTLFSDEVRNTYSQGSGTLDQAGFIATESTPAAQYHKFELYIDSGTAGTDKIVEIVGLDVDARPVGVYA